MEGKLGIAFATIGVYVVGIGHPVVGAILVGVGLGFMKEWVKINFEVKEERKEKL